MKANQFIILIVSICSFCSNYTGAQELQLESEIYQEISEDDAQAIAVEHLYHFSNGNYSINGVVSIPNDRGNIIAKVYELLPVGYIVVPASALFKKVIAYSFESTFGEIGEKNPLYMMLKADITNKIRYYSKNAKFNSDEKQPNLQEYSIKQNRTERFEQWPSVGDGWLKTNWTQTAPYNNLCPMDPITQVRSYAGCPSVAMGMILDFHRNTNNTIFDDNDDYYHNYAGRNYQIDDDYEEINFASFLQLNDFLDTLNMHWANNQALTATDKAALVFACGVACKQVYTSEGSGTFGVDQALEAYLRFGFSTVHLLDENDEDLWVRIQQNIKDTMPAHLAVVDEAWQTGHNVVVDGYNTSDYYHINFGWGGSYNGWYLLPGEFPMGLTVVEGIVLDIMKDTTTANTSIKHEQSCFVYPNPAGLSLQITFSNPNKMSHTLLVYNSKAQLMETVIGIKDEEITLLNANKTPGLYIYKLLNEQGVIGVGKFIIK